MPVVFQMAVTHAQFELIHPFGDGNGRVGRCLTQAVLVRRLGTNILLPPISTVLASSPDIYIDSLQKYREGDLDSYIETFSKAVSSSIGHMNFLANAVEDLQNQWLQRLGNPRKRSLQEKAVGVRPKSPVVDANSMSSILGVDTSQTIRTLNRLATAGIVVQATPGRRNRIWLAGEIIQIFDEYDFTFPA